MNTKSKLHYGFIILITVSLIRGFAGPIINASSGLFLTPVATEFGVGIGKLSIYLSISSITTLLWLPVAGNFLKKKNAKTAALISVLLQTLAFSAFGVTNSVWGFYLLSVPLAMGGTLLVSLLGPVLISRWFSAKIGLIMGIMMTITSLFGAVFQPILTKMIDIWGWRLTYIISGLFSLIGMTVLILLFLRDKPSDINLTPYESKTEKKQTNTDDLNSHPSLSAQAALKSPAFYLLFLFVIALTGFAVFSQHISTYGLGLGYPITSIGIALSFSMIGSAIGSILLGISSDKLGIIPTSIATMAMGILSISLFLLKASSYPIFILATFFHGLATSSIGVIAPLLVSTYFGTKDYEKLFSYVMMALPFASIILVPLYGFTYDYFRNYQPILLFLLIALVTGAVSVYAGYLSSCKALKQSQ